MIRPTNRGTTKLKVRGLQTLNRCRWCLAPSPTTSGKSSGQRTKLRRGEHGRHRREIHGEVHVIHEVGPKGNPLSPPMILAKFSNQVACIVKDKVEITWEEWNNVPVDYKTHI